jgi:hypothetical protein
LRSDDQMLETRMSFVMIDRILFTDTVIRFICWQRCYTTLSNIFFFEVLPSKFNVIHFCRYYNFQLDPEDYVVIEACVW